MSQSSLAVFPSLLCGVLVGSLIYANTRKRSFNPRRAIVGGVVAFVLVMTLTGILSSIVEVETGTVAVVTQFGQVITVFQPGLNFKLPFIQETVVYRTREITYETSAAPESSDADYPDYQVDTATLDGQQISVRFTVRFRIDSEQVSTILINLGTEREMVEKVVRANARVRVRNLLKRYTAADLYSGNIADAETVIWKALTDDYKAEGIVLVFFGLRSIQFTEDYVNAIKE